MEIDLIKVLSFILVFVPGYIFIHTLDYNLLRGEKSQFEKTIQTLLSSTVLWIIFIIIPFQPLNDQKEIIKNLLLLVIKNPNNKCFLEALLDKIQISLILFLLLCFYSFIISTLYSFFRKTSFISNLIQKLTKRDYFKNISLRFYSEGLNKVVIITLKNNNRYLGRLIGTPDREDDHNIILYDPYIIENNKLEKLYADRLLVDTKNVDLIEIRMEGD